MYKFTQRECNAWLKDPFVNPVTGRSINPNATSSTSVYQQLLKQCENKGLLRDTKRKTNSGEKTSTRPSSNTAYKPIFITKASKYELPVVKEPASLWQEMTREEVISLAERVLNSEPAAINAAMNLKERYQRDKTRVDDIYKEWARSGEISDDAELELAGNFLGRLCRCVDQIRTKNLEEMAQLQYELENAEDARRKTALRKEINRLKGFGVCQSSIYNKRGMKGIATRGDNAVTCDEDLAHAQNIITKSQTKLKRV